ncbi:testis-expressed protein 47-like isoform X2 [Scyliorhinus canicula]|uniref:testis-expressed protein 47-like isoform X2 n=1 Tax=Scyliorhinus canicula TaxID=7830 RepID=UPI0018F5EDCB|nr:testis-expressed protein 47-like isoform X2 [Scyliorhinus canicula]
MASSVFTASYASTNISQTEKLATVERNSLYMNLQDLQCFLNKKFILHRLIYISSFDPAMTDRKQISDYYEALAHKLHSQYQEMPITGLLLMHSAHYIHLLESSIDVLYSVIRDLTNQSSEEGLVQSAIKILILSHNIPDRLYRQWLQRPVNLPVTLMMDASEMEPVEKVVPECLTLLLKLGNYIQQNPKKNITGPNHTVSEEIRHLIIKENTIKYLCGSPELMTPQKFLEYYEKSTYVVLDSELVWPSPLHLFLGA